MRVKKKIGEILVEGGLITEKQLQSALPQQKKSKLNRDFSPKHKLLEWFLAS